MERSDLTGGWFGAGLVGGQHASAVYAGVMSAGRLAVFLRIDSACLPNLASKNHHTACVTVQTSTWVARWQAKNGFRFYPVAKLQTISVPRYKHGTVQQGAKQYMSGVHNVNGVKGFGHT